jgi:hypothetical protein
VRVTGVAQDQRASIGDSRPNSVITDRLLSSLGGIPRQTWTDSLQQALARQQYSSAPMNMAPEIPVLFLDEMRATQN